MLSLQMNDWLLNRLIQENEKGDYDWTPEGLWRMGHFAVIVSKNPYDVRKYKEMKPAQVDRTLQNVKQNYENLK